MSIHETIGDLLRGQMLRCDDSLNVTSAEIARIRLHGIVRMDRERAQDYMPRKTGRFKGGITQVIYGAIRNFGGKPIVRVRVRR